MPFETFAKVVTLQKPGQVLTGPNRIMEAGLYLLQVLFCLFGTVAPGILLGLLALSEPIPNNRDLNFIFVFIGIALAPVMALALFKQFFKTPWAANYMFNKARNEFSNRPDSIVDLNNPEAIFVEIIPRQNWGPIAHAEDLGFLFLDKEGSQILIEGDKKRYRIPLQSLLFCEIEPQNYEDEENMPVPLVVVNCRACQSNQEIPLRAVRTAAGDCLGNTHWERAKELHWRIISLVRQSGIDLTPKFEFRTF